MFRSEVTVSKTGGVGLAVPHCKSILPSMIAARIASTHRAPSSAAAKYGATLALEELIPKEPEQ